MLKYVVSEPSVLRTYRAATENFNLRYSFRSRLQPSRPKSFHPHHH